MSLVAIRRNSPSQEVRFGNRVMNSSEEDKSTPAQPDKPEQPKAQ